MTERPLIAPSLVPTLKRGLSCDEAAAYIGISPNRFREMVDAGTMPKPVHIGRRVLWDVRKLDAAWDALSGDTAGADEWEAFTAGGKR